MRVIPGGSPATGGGYSVSPHPRRRLPAVVLALFVLHGLALLAEPLSPYAPDEQHRDFPYAPPARLHLLDAVGRWHLVPFVHPLEPVPGRVDAYREVTSVIAPLRFVARVPRYRLAGVLTLDRRLVTATPPGTLFLLGTDRYGRDLLSRLLAGARLSLFAGALATALALAVGSGVGIVSGFYGGRIDRALTWVTSLFLSLPWIYLLLAARSLMPLDVPPERAFVIVVVLVGLVGWGRCARVVRGVVLAARRSEYLLAARSCGAGDLRILVRHLVPQAAGTILTQAALMVPACVMAEITLSFLGLGLSEPAPSWGTLAAGVFPPGLVVTHWWLAAPLAAMVPVFALYERAARVLGAAARGGALAPLEAVK